MFGPLNVSFELCRVGGVLKSPSFLAIEGGKGVNGVWIAPGLDVIQGRIRKQCDDAGIEPVKLPGYWYTREGEAFNANNKASKADKVLYTLHGMNACG